MRLISKETNNFKAKGNETRKVPVQVNPFPKYPSLQAQVKLPGVFAQIA